MKYLIIILFPLSLFGQTSDTLTKCKAWANTFITCSRFNIDKNGHLYNYGFVQHYDSNGNGLPTEAVKIDLTAGTTTYKTMPNSIPAGFWQTIYDSIGRLFIDFNYEVQMLDFSDTLQIINMGNVMQDGRALDYSKSIGRDGNIYFGGSQTGDKTYWSVADKNTLAVTKHPAINPSQDYVLNIAGDSDWVYAQVGQFGQNELWAVRKSDDYKKLLFTISTSNRFNLRVYWSGIFVSWTDSVSHSYKLHDSIATVSGFPASGLMEYSPFENFREAAYFNESTSQISYTPTFPNAQTVSATIPINSAFVQSTVGRVFAFPNDTSFIYYTGSQYGNLYAYDRVHDTAYRIGSLGQNSSSGFNLYSMLAVNDSIVYLGCYPNGSLLKWNRNKPWTLFNAINGVVEQGSKTSNPQICGNFRSYAGFHHCTLLIQDKYGNIVGAGGVIRTSNTCSIGVYNPIKDSMYGYDDSKILGLGESDLAVFRNHILFATNNTYGGTPKIYFYNSLSNQMDDSLTINGYNAYSHIYVIGDLLLGSSFGDSSNNYLGKLFKINLRTKRVLMDMTLNAPIGSNGLGDDGFYYINSTATNIPKNFWRTVVVNYSGFGRCGNMLCRPYNNSIIGVRNLLGNSLNIDTARGRFLFNKKQLGF